jgi:choline dehydrogenase-like flavoprotein
MFRAKKVEEDFLRAAVALGMEEKPDMQTLNDNNAWARWRRYISPDGRRSDTAHAHLHPRLRDGKHPNLHVLVQNQVVRVLFDETKRACGVEYRANPRFNNRNTTTPTPAAPQNSKHTVRARRLVVVSCGACGTPSVLERSGLGRADVLEKAGVPLVEDLPGVGHDYQDHHLILWPYRTALEPGETMDELFQGRLSFEEARSKNDPRLGWNTIDIASKLRPTEEEVAELGPQFKARWDSDFRDKPNRPLMLLVPLNA